MPNLTARLTLRPPPNIVWSASSAHNIYAHETPPLPRCYHAGMALRIAVVVLVFAVGFTARLAYEEITDPTAVAFAQEDQYDCASFGSQESAQTELDLDRTDPNNLDPDGNGVACEDYDYGVDDGSAAGDQYDDGDDAIDDGTVRPQGDSRRTPRTGGPMTDTFPLLDDGTCPSPLVKQNGACYPR